MSIPQDLEAMLYEIRNALYGQEVRENIADSLEYVYETAEEFKDASAQSAEEAQEAAEEIQESAAKIDDLESELSPQKISYRLSRLPWTAGRTLDTNGTYVNSSNRASENIFIYAKAGTKIVFSPGYVLRYAAYSDVDFNTGINQFIKLAVANFVSSPVTLAYDAYYRFAVGLGNGTAITAEQASGMFIEDYPFGLSVAGNKIIDIMPYISTTRGLFLASNGAVSLHDKGIVTDFISVDSANLYTYKIRTKETSETYTNYSRVIAYDENKEFLSVISRQSITNGDFESKDIILTIPAGCKYIRASYPYQIVDVSLECYSATDQISRMALDVQAGELKTIIGEKFAVKRNNADLVSQMIAVANSYKDQTDVTWHYGTTTPLSVTYDANAQSNHNIDCSTFLGFILRGITFEESPYLITYPPEELYEAGVRYFDIKQFVANPEFVWSINPAKYEYDLFQDVDLPEYAEARRASQICQMMAEQGRDVPLDKYMANIDVGDLIFFAKKDENGEYVAPDRYRHITHIALITEVSPAPQDASWDTSLYPYKHTYIEVSGGGSIVKTRVLEEQTISPTVNGLGTLSCVMRPDLGAISDLTGAIKNYIDSKIAEATAALS